MINRVSKIVAGHKEEHSRKLWIFCNKRTARSRTFLKLPRSREVFARCSTILSEYLKSAKRGWNKQDNYFPRVWDTQRISNDVARFKSLLENDYKAAYGKDADPSMINGIVNTLILNRGATPVTENQYRRLHPVHACK